MSRGRASFVLAAGVLALLTRAAVARADCTEDAGCAFNQYCGLGDGGVAPDASAGSCLAQPCVVASDCPNGELCDTSHAIFQCVQCISTADCSGNLVCDPTTRTCVPPPPPVDAGEDSGAALDAASPVDASPAPDSAAPPPHDAGAHDAASPSIPDASEEAGYDAGPSPGSLAGGACDCDVARPAVGIGALGAPLAVGLLFAIRRRRRRA